MPVRPAGRPGRPRACIASTSGCARTSLTTVCVCVCVCVGEASAAAAAASFVLPVVRCDGGDRWLGQRNAAGITKVVRNFPGFIINNNYNIYNNNNNNQDNVCGAAIILKSLGSFERFIY